MQRDDAALEHASRLSERRAIARLIRKERKRYQAFLARGDTQHNEWSRAIYVCDSLLQFISWRK
jgi:hypothetical protein